MIHKLAHKRSILARNLAALFVGGGLALSCNNLMATDGTWLGTSGAWSDSTKWLDGVVPDGADFTANFTGVDIAANQTINLNDIGRTIGNITFTDQTTGTPSNDLIISGSNTLTLDVTTGAPVINVTQFPRSITINSVIAGSDGLNKIGAGTLVFGGNNTYAGDTTVTQGVLDFAATSLDGIGGGTGRNIIVSAGAGVKRTNPDNAFLNRIAETSDEITIMMQTTGPNGATAPVATTLDFSSSTGANLPNAFLGNWANNGAKTDFTGTYIPASDAYRLGSPVSNGLLGMRSTLTGTQGLIVGGSRVNLIAANTFTGETSIRTGAKLTLGNNLALQNSPLNVGSAGGNFALAAGTNGGRITGETNASSPTFGGLVGSRNLISVFTSANGNNETNLAASAITGFTLNTGTGVNVEYSGAIGGFGTGAVSGTGGSSTLTKTGDGTQVLSGLNTYTGLTTISGGELRVSGSGTVGTGAVSNAASFVVDRSGLTTGAITGVGTTTVAAAAGLTAPSIRQGSLSIAGGATATISPHAGSIASGVSYFSSTTGNALTIAANGVLDTTNNDIIVAYAPGQGASSLATIRQRILDGYTLTGGAAWITSSTALADGDKFLVAFDNAAIGVTEWEGISLTGTDQVIAKYTLFGDLNLDGVVNGDDYVIVDGNFGTGIDWLSGDANLDGVVNSDDYVIIDGNFGKSLPTGMMLTQGGGALGAVATAVPEPSSFVFGGIASVGLMGYALRRRRSQRR